MARVFTGVADLAALRRGGLIKSVCRPSPWRSCLPRSSPLSAAVRRGWCWGTAPARYSVRSASISAACPDETTARAIVLQAIGTHGGHRAPIRLRGLREQREIDSAESWRADGCRAATPLTKLDPLASLCDDWRQLRALEALVGCERPGLAQCDASFRASSPHAASGADPAGRCTRSCSQRRCAKLKRAGAD